MEFLGVGPSELVFIVIIALIILGPKDMKKAGKTLGKWMRDIVTSDAWKMWQRTSHELQTLPNRLMREANEDLNRIGKELTNAANLTGDKPNNQNTPPRSQPMPIIPTPAGTVPENTIAPSAPTETKANESDQEKDA